MTASAKVASEETAREQRPRLDGILETALTVEDVARAMEFYRKVLGLAVLIESERLGVLNAGPRQVLLLFRRGASLADIQLPGGRLPGGIDAKGRSHMAFAVPGSELDAWEDWLKRNSIEIESVVRWERGGRSVYFRDPDGNLLELATPGVWANY